MLISNDCFYNILELIPSSLFIRKSCLSIRCPFFSNLPCSFFRIKIFRLLMNYCIDILHFKSVCIM